MGRAIVPRFSKNSFRASWSTGRRWSGPNVPPLKGLRSIEPRSMLDQLVELGVFVRDLDGRCNVPDLYRVAMNMKRRGGIRLAR